MYMYIYAHLKTTILCAPSKMNTGDSILTMPNKRDAVPTNVLNVLLYWVRPHPLCPLLVDCRP